MEEADTLCQRIGIMVNGRLSSIGTQAHLKAKHGEGYRLSITVVDDNAQVDRRRRSLNTLSHHPTYSVRVITDEIYRAACE
jgi:ABC-type multidrug transport system ATPase subunit